MAVKANTFAIRVLLLPLKGNLLEVYSFTRWCDYLQVNFGCILNDTEVTRYVNITNNSPQEVKYKWSFLLEEGVPVTTYHSIPTPPPQVMYPLQPTTVHPHPDHR